MVLGVPCSAPFLLNDSTFQEAARRITHDFRCVDDANWWRDNAITLSPFDDRFVGLTSEWDSSICLFHKMLGGMALPVEFMNTRPHSGNPSHPKSVTDTRRYRESSFRNLEGSPVDDLWHDQWDEALYKVAQKRFAADLAHARLRV